MTLIAKLPIRLICAFALASVVTACGGTANNGVRTGPQAIHPSPSALAQGVAVAGSGILDCHRHDNKGCHSHGNDGSQPILH